MSGAWAERIVAVRIGIGEEPASPRPAPVLRHHDEHAHTLAPAVRGRSGPSGGAQLLPGCWADGMDHQVEIGQVDARAGDIGRHAGTRARRVAHRLQRAGTFPTGQRSPDSARPQKPRLAKARRQVPGRLFAGVAEEPARLVLSAHQQVVDDGVLALRRGRTSISWYSMSGMLLSCRHWQATADGVALW